MSILTPRAWWARTWAKCRDRWFAVEPSAEESLSEAMKAMERRNNVLLHDTAMTELRALLPPELHRRTR